MEETFREIEEENRKVREILKGKLNQPFGFLETVIHYYNRITLRVLCRLGLVLYVIAVPIYWVIAYLTYVEPLPVWKIIIVSFIITLFTYVISCIIGVLIFMLFLLYKTIPICWKWIWEEKK
jgi:hypothetical protein